MSSFVFDNHLTDRALARWRQAVQVDRGPSWPDWRLALLSDTQAEDYADDPELYELLHDDDAGFGELDLQER